MPFVALSRTARVLVVAAVAATGCYPEFSFEGSGGNGGAPTSAETSTARVAVGPTGSTVTTGQTSTTGHMTSSSTTGSMNTSGSTTSGIPVVVQVSCGPPDYDVIEDDWFLSACQPGQVCCFDINNPFEDACGSECDPEIAHTFGCDGPQDCAQGEMCCASVSGSAIVGTGCVLGCGSPNIVLCESTDDCPSGTCQQVFSDYGYEDEYLGCL